MLSPICINSVREVAKDDDSGRCVVLATKKHGFFKCDFPKWSSALGSVTECKVYSSSY